MPVRGLADQGRIRFSLTWRLDAARSAPGSGRASRRRGTGREHFGFGVGVGRGHTFLQQFYFSGGQCACRSAFQPLQRQRSLLDAQEFFRLMSQRGENTPDLAVDAFRDGDFDHGVFVVVPDEFNP